MTTENETPEVENQEEENKIDRQELLDVVNDAVDEVTVVEEIEPGDDEPKDDEPKDDEPKDDEPKDDEPKDDGDPVNDPIPESLNAATQKRMRSLIDTVKARTTEAEQGQEIIDTINATGADPDQFAGAVGFLKLINSSDVAERKSALEIARGVVNTLALELGEGTSVVDLSTHEDLVAEVEAGDLTETRALEIAAGRERQKLTDNRNAAAAEANASNAQTQANLAKGRTQLNDFEASTRASDADYDKLRPTFLGFLAPALRRAHPTEYGEVAAEVYASVKALDLADAAPRKAPPEDQRPLRPTGGGGGSSDKKTEPKSAIDAMSRALDGV